MTTTTTAAESGKNWTVTAQTEATTIGPTGKLVRGVQISFTTTTGTAGSVFVPAAKYGTLDHVKQLIARKANHIIAVGKLKG